MLKILAWAYLIMSFADGGLTMYGLANGANEANELMKRVYELSPFLFFAIKFGVTILIFFGIRRLHELSKLERMKWRRVLAVTIISLLALGQTLVVVYNIWYLNGFL